MNAGPSYEGRLPDPPVMIIGDRCIASRAGQLGGLLDLFRNVLDGGARWLLVREKDLEPGTLRALVDDVRTLAVRYDAFVSVAGSPGVPSGIAAHGAHLPSAVLRSSGTASDDDATGHRSADDGSLAAGGYHPAASHRPRSDTDLPVDDHSDDTDHEAKRTERDAGEDDGNGIGGADHTAVPADDPAPTVRAARRAVDAARRRTERGLVGVSCHDGDEVARAVAASADYVTLSPIFPSTSKPGYGPPLGTDVLHRIVGDSPIPVVALGGVTAGTARSCREAGAAGIAVLGAVAQAENPSSATAEIIRAWSGSRAG